MDTEKFKDKLIHLTVIIEEIKKINIEKLETKNKRNNMKRAKKLRNKKNRWIRRVRKKFKFCNNKQQVLGRPNSINEELKLRKITKKKDTENRNRNNRDERVKNRDDKR